MNALFYVVYEGTLPASPGSAATTISLNIPVGLGNNFGMMQPARIDPDPLPLPIGCADNSNARIIGYKFDFAGAAGLRPGQTENRQEIIVAWGGRQINDQANFTVSYLDDTWQKCDFFMKLVTPFTPITKSPSSPAGPIDLVFDTRNLLPGYYGEKFYLRLILEVDCSGDL